MDIITILLIALGLSMDAFAVSISSGFAIKNCRLRHAFLVGSFFGGFQALMPVIGWLAGMSLRNFISDFDHWIAFFLLVFIGGKMIYESTLIEKSGKKCSAIDLYVLFGLSVATSIDALAVGVTFAFLNVVIVAPVIVIGLVTFVLSFAGMFIGARMGGFFGNKMEVAGGVVLILIGFKILIEHLYLGGAKTL